MLGRRFVPSEFAKYQGLGNDFIIVEASEAEVSSEEARRLCDRRRGIGADGVLLVTQSPQADARMIVLNADGSRPEMCGNGLRCVARYLADTRALGDTFTVDTDAGVLTCELLTRDGVPWVKLGLGVARALPELQLEVRGRQLPFRRISTGNPHAVLFESPFTADEVDEVGPWVSAQIVGGANVEFVTQSAPAALDVVVWERGVGRTLACGTGAAAVGVAAALEGRAPFDTPISITLPGGVLEVSVAKADLALTLAGPAERVFLGRLPT